MTPRWIAVLVTFLFGVCAAHAADSGPVVVVPLHGEVSSAQFYFLRRAVKEAERRHASALVLDLDTYGGEVRAAIDEMDALLKTDIPTVTYVNPRALSAGALVSLSTRRIYMSPTAVIGAAAPVTSGGEDLPKTMSDKLVSAMSAMARAAAQKTGHNPELADAFIIKEKEVKIGDTVVDRPDSLLTLSAEEATRQFNGKPLLAEAVAPTLNEVLRMANLSSGVHQMEPTGFEHLAMWITALAPLLLLGGIIGAYVEIKTPGFGLPGIVSAVCFTLFFLGHYAAGLAGWEVVACFTLGLVLVISELFLHPGTVLPGVIGFVLMVASLIWAMIDRYPGDPFWPTSDMLVRPLTNMSIAIIAAAILMFLLAKYLPRTSIYQRIVLQEADPVGPGFAGPLHQRALSVGMAGVAKTTLRPSGKAEFDGRLVDVVSSGDFITGGAVIRVVMIEGARIVVEAAR